MKIAIFDFDGTIYKYETFQLFMKHLKEKHPLPYRRFFLIILPIYLGYKCKMIREQTMKRKLMYHYVQALRSLSTEELNYFFSEIAAKMDGDFHEEVIARINAHQEEGFHTLIVSGAFTPLLQSINENLAINTIIGTEIPAEKKMIDHVHAERKKHIILEQFRDNSINWKDSFAYGDSFSDLAVLELVGNPVAVAPDEHLYQVAKERNWEIIP